jgi:lipopolysaccharide/colanic/teichoic acid biosynthesis glycosyltransferase
MINVTELSLSQNRTMDWFKKFNPQKRILTGKAYFITKRLMDLFLVLVTLPFWFPLLSILALLVWTTSPGAPVFFKQLRTGKGGRRFHMHKFRTMVPNAEQLKAEYAHLNELQWPDFKITNDHRVTPLGNSCARQVWMNSPID